MVLGASFSRPGQAVAGGTNIRVSVVGVTGTARMGTIADTQRFRPLLTAQGPFVSIFFDDSHDTADADEQIEARWQEIHRALTRQGADQRACDAIEVAIRDERPVVGRRGRCLIATSDGVLVDVLLPSPPTTPVVRMSDYPYLLSLRGTDIWRPDYVFAVVDHEGADLTVHRGGGLSTRRSPAKAIPCTRPRPRV